MIKFSVIIPNYNHAEFLRERINSVLDQTYPPSEVIILDDCSLRYMFCINQAFLCYMYVN